MSQISKLGKKSIFGVIFALAIIGLCQSELTFYLLLFLIAAGAAWEIWTLYDKLTQDYCSLKQAISLYTLILLVCGILVGFKSISYILSVWYCLILIGTYCLVDACANLWGSFWCKTLKKHSAPFSPRWSPNKTWTGVWAGLLAGTIGFPFLIWLMQQIYPSTIFGTSVFLPQAPLATPQTYILGFTLAWLAVLGDLTFSRTKRLAHIKDFSVIWRGQEIYLLRSHGGILDRIDSWTITTIFVVIWLVLEKTGSDVAQLTVLLPYPVIMSIGFFYTSSRYLQS